jgi:hypothetical protein
LSSLAAALDSHDAQRNLAQNQGTVGSVAEFDDQVAKDRALSPRTFVPPTADLKMAPAAAAIVTAVASAVTASPCSDPACSVHKYAALRVLRGEMQAAVDTDNALVSQILERVFRLKEQLGVSPVCEPCQSAAAQRHSKTIFLLD